ncbi:hypothetical protein J1N35_019586 [Gossypium stocksii]|uniref:Uncharacterized protein n=1 Tax=Gossypium stocksii TaxID=47602 RepID=A0A9D3VRK3_9ROSI|nr:hypothetical protein J1N35_019586 [Gossypium stocksii]
MATRKYFLRVKRTFIHSQEFNDIIKFVCCKNAVDIEMIFECRRDMELASGCPIHDVEIRAYH